MSQNQLRLIGGRWRGRKFGFPDAEGLRPTPDRVRETLFNWLMHDTVDALCLDAFAGSGALGLEALSRGAKHVVFLEQNPKAATCIRTILKEIETTAQVTCTNTINYLKRPASQQFNLVFIDPPFQKNLIPQTLALLKQDWLTPKALIYIECEKELKLQNIVPPGFEILKDKQAGEVRYGLLQSLDKTPLEQ